MKGERHPTCGTELNPGCFSQDSNSGPSGERRMCQMFNVQWAVTLIVWLELVLSFIIRIGISTFGGISISTISRGNTLGRSADSTTK